MRIDGAVVAITGGARGIGLATARLLAARGAKVAIGDIDQDRVKQAATDLGITCYARLDVTDPASFAAFLDQVERELGPLDVLVNNAGIMPVGPLHEDADDVSRRVVEINLLGVIYGSKQAARRMLPRGRGHVINISSIVGENHVPGAATYCATKHAVSAFTESARIEYQHAGIRFSQVLPTFTNTELIAGTTKPPLFRNAEPAEIAAAVAALIVKPKPRVRVTAAVGAFSVAQRYFPRRVMEPLLRATGADTLFTDQVDPGVRQAYTERITRS